MLNYIFSNDSGKYPSLQDICHQPFFQVHLPELDLYNPAPISLSSQMKSLLKSVRKGKPPPKKLKRKPSVSTGQRTPTPPTHNRASSSTGPPGGPTPSSWRPTSPWATTSPTKFISPGPTILCKDSTAWLYQTRYQTKENSDCGQKWPQDMISTLTSDPSILSHYNECWVTLPVETCFCRTDPSRQVIQYLFYLKQPDSWWCYSLTMFM
ncbi:hypothetical protein KP79_PYT12123 [Mizuhopecten yessoensis]|uniref:Uncharacterized protein n=2 Tax=Mizuhopecten yessoensis TaxID=6573 RepID=A0A210Q2L4_MIZYE|nr:hypothetical protein KP79_PYT12123 [Mizuhopecten yessoensis]